MDALIGLLQGGGWKAYTLVLVLGVPLYLVLAHAVEHWLRGSDWLESQHWF